MDRANKKVTDKHNTSRTAGQPAHLHSTPALYCSRKAPTLPHPHTIKNMIGWRKPSPTSVCGRYTHLVSSMEMRT